MLSSSRQKLNTLTASRSEHPWYSRPARKPGINVKSLGVLIDAILTWGSHIEKLAKKIASGIAAIKRVRKFCSPSNIASYLQSLDSAAFRLLQCCLGNLWHRTSRQTSKTLKSCSASANFLKPMRCIMQTSLYVIEFLPKSKDITAKIIREKQFSSSN